MLMEARYVKDEKRQTCRAQKGTGLKSETWKNYSKGRTKLGRLFITSSSFFEGLALGLCPVVVFAATQLEHIESGVWSLLGILALHKCVGGGVQCGSPAQ